MAWKDFDLQEKRSDIDLKRSHCLDDLTLILPKCMLFVQTLT